MTWHSIGLVTSLLRSPIRSLTRKSAATTGQAQATFITGDISSISIIAARVTISRISSGFHPTVLGPELTISHDDQFAREQIRDAWSNRDRFCSCCPWIVIGFKSGVCSDSIPASSSGFGSGSAARRARWPGVNCVRTRARIAARECPETGHLAIRRSRGFMLARGLEGSL